MIIGNGDIGHILPDREDRLYFASGVSNSQETDEAEYERERQLLLEQTDNLRVIYFSSLSIFYTQSRYTKHKRTMEKIVKTFSNYCIVRIGTITWGKNPHLLINTFRNQLNQGQPLDVRDEYRYVLDQDEFLHWLTLIPAFNCEMNITGRMLKVSEILKEYV